MADNYKDTAYRMYESSIVLYNNNLWFNSNYLAGYVLECYCKLILSYTLEQGESLSQDNIRRYSHNIASMRDEIDLILQGEGVASQYCMDLSSECNNIIMNWNPNLRYESTTHILNDSTLANEINKEIEKLMGIILKMEVDGVI